MGLNKNGFTLSETVISLFLVTIVISLSTTMILLITRYNSSSNQINNAKALAESTFNSIEQQLIFARDVKINSEDESYDKIQTDDVELDVTTKNFGVMKVIVTAKSNDATYKTGHTFKINLMAQKNIPFKGQTGDVHNPKIYFLP